VLDREGYDETWDSTLGHLKSGDNMVIQDVLTVMITISISDY